MNDYLPQNTASEAQAYSSNYYSGANEYLVRKYSNMSTTDDINCDHPSVMSGYVSGYVQEMY